MSVVVTLLLFLLTLLFFGVPTGGDANFSATGEGAAEETSPVAGGSLGGNGLLVGADWLLQHADEPTLKVIALTPADEFATGHIPNAVALDWPELEITDTSDPNIARWQGEVEAILTRLGVRPEQTVVVYDGGTLYAPRLWWVLKQLGHADARVLDGGLAAWREAGGEVTTAGTWVSSSPAAPYRGTPDPALLAQLPAVAAALGDPGVVLVDARSAAEYAAGHIPGAVNVEFTRNAAPDDPKRWLPETELRALYEGAGVTPDKRVIAYCTTGVRSAVTYFTLRLLGYERVELFTGSWAEWSAHPELPVAAGDGP